MQRALLRRVLITLTCALAAATAISTAGEAASSPPAASLKCADFISVDSTVLRGYSVYFGRVGLPTGRKLNTADSGLRNPNAKLFAKQGLLVRTGKAADIVVPDAWKGRLSIAWGKPGKRTGHLRIPKCPSPEAGPRWLGYPGGFFVGKPACVPLRVEAAGETKVVHIGVGKRCPA